MIFFYFQPRFHLLFSLFFVLFFLFVLHTSWCFPPLSGAPEVEEKWWTFDRMLVLECSFLERLMIFNRSSQCHCWKIERVRYSRCLFSDCRFLCMKSFTVLKASLHPLYLTLTSKAKRFVGLLYNIYMCTMDLTRIVTNSVSGILEAFRMLCYLNPYLISANASNK